MKKLITLTVLSFIGINAIAFCGSQWENQSYTQCRQIELLQEQNEIIRQANTPQPAFPNSPWSTPQRQQQCYRNVWGQIQCF